MCHKYHGKGPSHRKQEKQRSKEVMEQKQHKISTGLNPALSNPLLATKQGKLGNLGTTGKKPKKI